MAAERNCQRDAQEGEEEPGLEAPRVRRRFEEMSSPMTAPPGLERVSSQTTSGERPVIFGRRGGATHLDARLVDKPGKYNGEKGEWRLWKARAVGWLAAVHPDFGRFLAAAEVHQGDMYVPQPLQEMSSLLHTELLAWLTGTQLALVLRNLPLGGGETNGFAAWRTLCDEEERLDPAAQVAVLQELLHPNFAEADGGWRQGWMEWEARLARHAPLLGSLGDAVCIGIVRGRAPDLLRDHLEVSAASYGADYAAFRIVVDSYLRAHGGSLMQKTLQDMPLEVDVITKGKGKGGKGDAARGECFHFRDTGSCKWGDRCKWQHTRTSASSSGGSSGHYYVCGDRQHRTGECPRRWREPNEVGLLLRDEWEGEDGEVPPETFALYGLDIESEGEQTKLDEFKINQVSESVIAEDGEKVWSDKPEGWEAPSCVLHESTGEKMESGAHLAADVPRELNDDEGHSTADESSAVDGRSTCDEMW
eukprot:CAMPEP_0203841912 /NCGR_PEP_ID=MMETSP0359-20131031/1673_1 /ASSEMBLY_ACC=CAM_ASM_000338 /TAXON_ID=268821 /ORGANISM="Scrippsiella Hangoei, Strain SHTV-5" /LENGTH=475 /DNA_ID=CAMNT_0050756415 /DNA_START=356 /DNA_END=1783 /DNA_ORIENTATION=+